MRRFDCVGYGLLTRDRILLLNNFPQPNQKLSVHSWTDQPGGPVAVGLMTMAALGLQVHWGLPLAPSAPAAFVTSYFEKLGLSHQRAESADNAISIAEAIILVEAPTGQRTVLLQEPPALPRPRPAELPPAEWVYLDGRDLALTRRAKQLAKAQGSKIFLDMGSLRPHWQEIVAGCDLAIVSDDVMRRLDPALTPAGMLRVLESHGVAIAGITLGQEGSLFLSQGRELSVPAVPPARLVDATNAGDVFHGAFLAAWIKSGDLQRSAEFAARCAAWAIGQIGHNLQQFRAAQADFPLAFL
ncbi:MAG: Sulfofructose kinase [bacterium]|nr:Sulfofructose kinase [bacterium]